jgi:hypothetical protein
MYSSTLSFTLALDGGGVVNATHRPTYHWEGKNIPIVEKAGWAAGTVRIGGENLTPTGIRSPDRSVRSELLYPLSYPGPGEKNRNTIITSTVGNCK